MGWVLYGIARRVCECTFIGVLKDGVIVFNTMGLGIGKALYID